MVNFFNEAVKSGQFMFMAEAEGYDGLVNTRLTKINAAARDIEKNITGYTPSGMLSAIIKTAARAHGINDLTTQEENYIKQRISAY